MRTKKWTVGLGATIALLFWGGPSFADVAFTLNAVSEVESPSLGADTVFGWTFQVPGESSILVTHVGVYDHNGDGLASAHDIGIWGGG